VHAGMDAWMMDAWMRGAGQCLVRRRQGRRKRKALGEVLQCLLCPSLNNHCEWDPFRHSYIVQSPAAHRASLRRIMYMQERGYTSYKASHH